MSILTKVWGGPFKAPPMVQPVSVGWVFLKILETLWRAVIVLIVIVALFAAGLWATEGKPLSSQVRVQLGKQGNSCADKAYPLDVALTNESNKTLGEISLKFRVYQRGKSEDVATYMSSTPRLNDILGPGRTIFYCFRMPELEPGSTGPYTLAVDVTYASEISKDVPAAAEPPVVRFETPANSSSAPRPWWGKVTDVIVVLLGVGLFASGGYGLVGLFDRVFKARMMERLNLEDRGRGCLVIIMIVGMTNALLVVIASYLLGAVGWGGWMESLDVWSRSTGFADGVLLLLTAVACQWPWAVLLALPRRDVDAGGVASVGDDRA